MIMLAKNLTFFNKVKIEGKWFKIRRVWKTNDEITIFVSVGSVKYRKDQKVEAK